MRKLQAAERPATLGLIPTQVELLWLSTEASHIDRSLPLALWWSQAHCCLLPARTRTQTADICGYLLMGGHGQAKDAGKGLVLSSVSGDSKIFLS